MIIPKYKAFYEKHGMTGTPEHHAWIAMKMRCHNPNDKDFEAYGGRGISVCKEWQQSFTAFMSCVGKRPGRNYSIDRIDVNGDYEPLNVRWATKSQQTSNQRRYLEDAYSKKQIIHNPNTGKYVVRLFINNQKFVIGSTLVYSEAEIMLKAGNKVKLHMLRTM